MNLPLQITFRGIAHSQALADAARSRLAKLEHLYEDLQSCRVVIGLDERHTHKGRRFIVRLDLKVPGAELLACQGEHEEPHAALREAFDAAKRQLESTLGARATTR